MIYILNKLNISSRATHSILKIARTISDLKEEKNISKEALLEAIEHRKNGENMLEKWKTPKIFGVFKTKILFYQYSF